MITIRRGSRVHELLSILAYVGEYPMRAIRLLGDASSWYKLIQKLSQQHDFRTPDGSKTFHCRMLTVSGSGRLRSVRLYKAALPILECALPDAYRYYMQNFGRLHHTGKESEIDRTHRVAESSAMCSWARIDSCQYLLPKLQAFGIQKRVLPCPTFYMSKNLKYADEDGGNRTKFSRLTGAIFYPGGCYAVYNSRDTLMKWNGQGEMKTRLYLTHLARMNAGVGEVSSAILFGSDFCLALRTLLSLENVKREDLRFDKIYAHMHYIPMNAFGAKLLRILTVPDWNETLLNMLFEPEDRSFNRGAFEYDAIENGVYILSFLDSDIVRLTRFRAAIAGQHFSFEILCFLDQVSFLRKYFGNQVKLRMIDMDLVEEAFFPEQEDEDG